MNYCSNCRVKLDKEIYYCTNCGVEVNQRIPYTPIKIKKENKVASIISMFLGIISFLYSLFSLSALGTIGNVMEEDNMAYKIGFAIGFVIIQSVLAIISITLALTGSKKRRDGFVMIGFWLSIVTFCLVILAITYIISYNN